MTNCEGDANSRFGSIFYSARNRINKGSEIYALETAIVSFERQGSSKIDC